MALQGSSADTRYFIVYSPNGSSLTTAEREHVLSATSSTFEPHFDGFEHSMRICGRMSVDSA